VYDAITSKRSYAEPKLHVSALKEIKQYREAFDPLALNALIQVVLRNDKLSRTYDFNDHLIDPEIFAVHAMQLSQVAK